MRILWYIIIDWGGLNISRDCWSDHVPCVRVRRSFGLDEAQSFVPGLARVSLAALPDLHFPNQLWKERHD